jgi:DNA-binding response OmpR family regulator
MENLTVLIVDDNAAHGDGLAELLELNGFAALHASTGSTGLQIAATHPVDAVLLDVNLPDMTGYEVCRKIRSHSAMDHIAIVFHTGTSSPNREHGGDAFLTYPIASSELFVVIQGCVYRRRMKMASSHSKDATRV